jgi:hypothetical protein
VSGIVVATTGLGSYQERNRGRDNAKRSPETGDLSLQVQIVAGRSAGGHAPCQRQRDSTCFWSGSHRLPAWPARFVRIIIKELLGAFFPHI